MKLSTFKSKSNLFLSKARYTSRSFFPRYNDTNDKWNFSESYFRRDHNYRDRYRGKSFSKRLGKFTRFRFIERNERSRRSLLEKFNVLGCILHSGISRSPNTGIFVRVSVPTGTNPGLFRASHVPGLNFARLRSHNYANTTKRPGLSIVLVEKLRFPAGGCLKGSGEEKKEKKRRKIGQLPKLWIIRFARAW